MNENCTPTTRLNSLRRVVSILLALAGLLSLGLAAQAQDLPPAPPGSSYYEYSDGTSTTYELLSDSPEGLSASSGGGRFSADDSPPSPGGSPESGGPPTSPYIPPQIPGTNLWLIIQQQSNYAVITFSNAVAGLPYVLLTTTNLATGPWITNQSFLATNSVSIAPQLVPLDGEAMFFEGVQETPGTVRWVAELVDQSTNSANSFGNGLEAAPSLSPDQSTIYMSYFVGDFTTAGESTVSALDFLTGDIQWTRTIFNDSAFAAVGQSPQTPEYTSSSAVSADGSNIITGSIDGNVYCLTPEGTTNWISPVGNFVAVYSTPALWSNRVFAPTDEALGGQYLEGPTGLACLNLDGLTTNYFFQPQDLFYGNFGETDSSPAVDSAGNAYFLTEGHRLYCVGPDGIRWYLPVAGYGEPDSSPAIGPDGTIYVGSASDFVYAVNPDGSLRWVYDIGSQLYGSPLVGPDNTVYVASLAGSASGAGCLVALTNGVKKWEFDDYNGFEGSPVLGEDGTVYIGDGANGDDYDTMGYVMAVTNGNVEWSYQTGGYPIASGLMIAKDGTVLVAAEDGNLYAFWGGTPLATNGWPCFHHDPQLSGFQADFTPSGGSCAAPFLSNGTNDGMGNFTFSIVGPSNSVWDVWSSTNLTNWTEIASGLTLEVASDTTNSSGTNTFTDATVSGVPQRFYQLANTNAASKIIGFTTLTIQPGTNVIADQLYQVDDIVLYNGNQETPMNTLNALFAVYNPLGTNAEGTEILQWNGSGFDTDGYRAIPNPHWTNSGNIILVPGQSAFIVNSSLSAWHISFVGLVRNEQVFDVENATNYLSATAPVSGALTNVTGLTPHEGDTVQLWNSASNRFISYTYQTNSWSNGVPFLNVGQGFVLITTNRGKWTNYVATGSCGQ